MEADLNQLQKESDTLTVRCMTRQYSVRCVRAALVSRFLNHYPATKSDCCLRRRAARTAAVHGTIWAKIPPNSWS